jgi:tetratricopeptide (TPR) repeat protein
MEASFTPKGFSPSDEFEDDSVSLVKALMAKNKNVKPILGGNDKTANRDGIIELRNATHTVGKLEVQLKPIDSTRKKSGRLCYQLPGHMIAYSEVAGLPFILVCYDRDASKAYWKLIDRSLLALFKDDADSTTLEFQAEDEIDDGQPYARRWFEISDAHLEGMRLLRSASVAFKILKDDKAFGDSLDSANDLAELMKRVLSTSSGKFKTCLEQAKKCFDQSEITAASKLLEELSAELENNEQERETYFDVLIWLGNCRYRLENMQPAEECFRKALALDKNSPRAQTNLAHILYVQNTGKVEALTLAKAGWEGRPEHEPSLGVYMMCLNFNRCFSELEVLKREKASIINRSSVLQLSLGQIARENSDYKTACLHFNEVLNVDSNYHHSRILFAECAYKLVRKACLDLLGEQKVPDPEIFKTELDNAFEALEKAIVYFTQTTDRMALHRAYDIRASIQMLRGKFEEALVDCEKMDAVLPKQITGQIVRAQIYIQLERFADVVDLLKPYANSDRQDIAQSLGYSYSRLKEWQQAALYFKKYIDEDESSDAELLAYVQCLWFSEKKRDAYLLAHKLRKAGRATKEIMREVELARLRETDQWSSASDIVEDLIKIAPDDAEFYLHRISINIERGQRTEAQKNHEQFPRDLLESDPWAQGCFIKQENLLRQLGWIMAS